MQILRTQWAWLWAMALAGTVAAAGAMPGSVHPALRMPPVPGGQGVNIHFYQGNTQDWSMLEAAGVGIVRMDVSWAGCEKEPGVYDFAHYDQLVGDLEARHMRLLFIIDYGNPLYDDGLSPHTEACRAAYGRFCAALAGRYAGKDVIWELWNEPNIGFWKPEPNVDDYMAWCKAVVPAIRAADSEACIIAPATSGIALSFLESCFQQGLLDLVDGVSVHPYRSEKQGPETALTGYERLAALVDQYKPKDRKIPILSGEWGYSTTLLSDEQQGKYLPRQWLANLAAGVPISIWYDWHDDGKDPKEKEHNFGTVTWDYQPKPAYTAMMTLIEQLKGFTVAGRLNAGSDAVFLVAFERGQEYKLALWTTGEPIDVAAPQGITVTAAVDRLGAPLAQPEDAWKQVYDGPRYLTIAGDVPAWLRMMPLHYDVARSVAAGVPGGVRAQVSVHNPTNGPVEVTVQPVNSPMLQGAWGGDAAVRLGPDEHAELVWEGAVVRRDVESITLPLVVDIKAENEPTYRAEDSLALSVSNPISLQPRWRESGLDVAIQAPGTEGVTGTLVVDVNGQRAGETAVRYDNPGIEQVYAFDAIRLGHAPMQVGIRLEEESGRLLAEVAPMNYQLIDAVALEAGADPEQAYRIWDEGDADRSAQLHAAIVAAPGQQPPYPNALQVVYDIAPGWCFWQVGPKAAEMRHPQPRRFMFWVNGNAGGDRIGCRLVDASGQTFQHYAGSVDFEGWHYVVQDLETPGSHWGGADDGVVQPPLRWTSYYLQDPLRKASAGTTCLTGVVVAW